jgi:ATP-dependent DNA helicase RecG
MARLHQADLMRDLGVATPEGELLRAGEVLFCVPSTPPLHYQYRNTPGGEVAHEFREPVPGLIAFDEVMDRVNQRGNAVPILLRDGQQIDVRDFPELAVREALVNAVAHRDYGLDATVSIEHSPQLFTIQSPGSLVAGVSVENILTHASKPRNPLLAGVAHQLGLAERSGRGVDRIYREMIRSGKQPPVFEADPLDTRVSLAGGAPNKRFATYAANLPEGEQEDVDTMLVLFALTQSKRVDAPGLAPILQRNVDATEMILRRLASDEVGMIAPSVRTARSANPKYYLRPEGLRALGPALAYRSEGHDVMEEKIVQLVETLGTVENKTVQISCDVDVQTASSKLRDLAQRGVLEKLGSQERGPGIKYGPGPNFPKKVSRRARRRA